MGLLEAGLLGIAPALVLFYWTFDSYDRVVADRGLFLSLGAGLVLGYLFALPELAGVFILDPFAYGPQTNTTIIVGAVVSVFAIAFYQEGLRGLTLNMPRIRGTWQNPFWGVSLGLGSGAVFVVTILASRGLTMVDVLPNLPFAVAVILAHAGFGGLLGLGVSELRAVRGFFIASIGHMVLNGLRLVERFSAPLLRSPLLATAARWGLVVAMLAYGAWLYRHMLRQLPRMLPKDKQTERRRMLRGAGS